ncbi:unnamed protein product [Caenorhabditis sp. 36 PRJEB53466]|nr:unnamed protein product [Caenorhabditis sp. 36 PRJEB53466]
MDDDANPDDEKFLQSLQNLMKIGEQFKKLQKNKPAAAESESQVPNENEEESDEKPVEIPPEQQIEPAERIEPLKSMVAPEYVRKVIKEMDVMTTEQLKQALLKIKAPIGGNRKTLRKRVAMYYRKENQLLNRKMDPNSDKTARYFDYLIAIDFECTCVEVIYDYPHEIIELPAVLIDVREMKIISEFRTYVRPVRNPILSDFCVQFTKIHQETVENAPYFREALLRLYTWMRKFGLGEKNTRFAFVTDGPHDMWKFMQFQCLLSNIRMPHMFRSFINVKKTFKEKFNGLVKGNGKSGIENMLERLGLTFRGNKHSGLDDARNIAAITIELMKLKIELRINQKCSYKEVRAGQKEHEEELEDTVDTSSVDISRRDFQLWLRRLPLKLQSVTRREFLNEEYLDCDSCDDMTDDKDDEAAYAEKMAIRKELEELQDQELERMFEKSGYFVIGEVVQRDATEHENVDNDESEEEDYQAQFDMLETMTSLSRNEIDLNTIWQQDAPGSERDDYSSQYAPEDFELSVQSTSSASAHSVPPVSHLSSPRRHSSVTSSPMFQDSPPRNSLASSNRRNYHHY